MYKEKQMTIHPIPTGRIDGRSYVAVDESGVAAVIDPDVNLEAIIAVLEAEGAVVKVILLTHCHFDHTGGAAALRERTGAPIAMHAIDADGVNDQETNMTASFGQPPVTGITVDRRLADGDRLPLGSAEIEVLHTPGHTAGGCCYHVGGDLFSGDTLFRGAYGTTHCTGGSMDALRQSISRLYLLDGETVIWPGHGHKSTIERERKLDLINK
jgi:hydroxyacylglutathione hydrolase